MSKFIEMVNGRRYTELADKGQCGWMYNEVCCCDESEWLADFPDEDACAGCKYFKAEDMEEDE